MRNLSGMVTWITGAGSGIGEGAALALAQEGVKVILTGRRKEPLELVASKITNLGGFAEVAQGDAKDRIGMQNIANNVIKNHGKIDLLFNNHGMNIKDRHWNSANLDDWDEVIDVNIKGVYNCTYAALKVMRPKKNGLIITTASNGAFFNSMSRISLAGVPYIASKHAVISLNDTMILQEKVNGIRGCVICPGEVETPILDKRPIPVSKEDRAKLIQKEDIGELIVFILKMPERVTLNEIIITPTHVRKIKPEEK
ncbi:MAG: SDR family oxidoreductase [Pelagibacterales bacterium]|nr:SDR family oxidoreductase [Pelagibacterales bacterium]